MGTFEEWRREVDAEVVRISGINLDGLCPEYDVYAAYICGDTPLTAAKAALRVAGFQKVRQSKRRTPIPESRIDVRRSLMPEDASGDEFDQF